MGLVLVPSLGGFGGRWAFPRSYVHGFAQNWPADCVVTIDGPVWKLTLPPAYGNVWKYMEFKANIYAWNSNCYTIDHLWENFYIQYEGSPPIAPEGVIIHYVTHPTTKKRFLAFDVGFWTEWYYFTLPPSPPDYWLPTD